VSPKLYCLHCYSRTGNKYPSHGYPGKPPYNHIPSAASPTHVPSAAPAPQTKPYAQSYISAPVPPQTHRVTFEDSFNQGGAYSQQHYPSNLSYGSSQSPAAYLLLNSNLFRFLPHHMKDFVAPLYPACRMGHLKNPHHLS
jgi:hypothetical protein